MGVIAESNVWEPEIKKIETGEPVAGGDSAPINIALQDLANRTLYLKTFAEDILSDLAAIAALVGDTSMGDVLLKTNNLSDLPNKATARENLGVSAVDHTHGAYMSKTANLSDVESPLTGRQNLGVTDILFGSGVPAAGVGKNGDVYIRTTDIDHVSIYKKAAGVWSLAIDTINIPGNAATATLAALATMAQACSGNSATADKWKTVRKLNGVNVDGSADATIPPHSTISLNTSGYIRLQGSGLILQWGRSATVNADSSLEITFPISFPNACFAVAAIILNSSIHTTSEGAITAGTPTTSGFKMVNGSDRGGPCSYFAIGY